MEEFREGQLIRPEIVQETTEKISQIKDRLKTAGDHQKSYADKEKERGMLAPLVCWTFEITVRGDRSIAIDYDFTSGAKRFDAKLNFVEEPMEILEREFKKLKRSRIPIVKVRCNSK
ncbi:hypothetical protein Tco_0960692 [Tanacetum coccineum]